MYLDTYACFICYYNTVQTLVYVPDTSSWPGTVNNLYSKTCNPLELLLFNILTQI